MTLHLFRNSTDLRQFALTTDDAAKGLNGDWTAWMDVEDGGLGFVPEDSNTVRDHIDRDGLFVFHWPKLRPNHAGP